MPTITPEVYQSMGLNDFEYQKILELMRREPTLTELGMFAVMWSEHCGYKYSRPVLAYFKGYKEALEGDGLENAGIVDIGDGLGVTMKVESHNHPSAVEPYQGAATGVGGIIRDILTMGARPIACLNSLRFGPIEGDGPIEQRNRHLVEGVVAGIAGYGNCVGVPTVGGEVGFHPRYSGNPLVNAMCVGLMRLDEVTTAAAAGVGNPVIYIGSATGKDGIHGATFASEALDDESEAKRPNVQIGDPFAEKLLIEATLEALQTGAIVAIQDMGAAGLTCSTIEMASKGSVGMSVNLDLVPMRENDMSAYELMLSESQERMLCVAAKGREHEVLDICKKWGLRAAVIGSVTSVEETSVTRLGEVAASVNPKHLTDFCPTYTTEAVVPEYYEKAKAWDPASLRTVDSTQALLQLLASPNIASKEWIYRQYDFQVQTQTTLIPGAADAAVLAPRGTKKGLSVKIDGNGRQVYFDPYVGGHLVVAEACRNVACTGARPVALTDGLNYGNPQKGHVYWQFERSVKGISEAAEALGTPVISGNVSFYNESDLGEVLPTPMIGALGVLDDVSDAIGMSPVAGTRLGLVSIPLSRIPQMGLGASEFLATVHGIEDGVPCPTDLAAESRLHDFLVRAAKEKFIQAAHDTADGGLLVALAEMAIQGEVGMEVSVENEAGALFGEIPGRVVIVFSDETQHLIGRICEECQLEFRELGTCDTTGRLRVGKSIDIEVAELERAYRNAIGTALA